MPESNQSNQEEAAEVIVVQEPTIDDVPYSQAERDQDAEDMKFMCPITMEFPIHIPTRANPSRDGVAFYIPHEDHNNRDNPVVLHVFSLAAVDNLMENREYDDRFSHPITRSPVYFRNLSPEYPRSDTPSLMRYAQDDRFIELNQKCRDAHTSYMSRMSRRDADTARRNARERSEAQNRHSASRSQLENYPRQLNDQYFARIDRAVAAGRRRQRENDIPFYIEGQVLQPTASDYNNDQSLLDDSDDDTDALIEALTSRRPNRPNRQTGTRSVSPIPSNRSNNNNNSNSNRDADTRPRFPSSHNDPTASSAIARIVQFARDNAGYQRSLRGNRTRFFNTHTASFFSPNGILGE